MYYKGPEKQGHLKPSLEKPLFEWNDEFSVGVETLDNDHKKIFSLLNAIHRAIANDAAMETVNRVLEELRTYSHRHFQSEEMAMVRSSYPLFDQHVIEHKVFASKVEEFSDTAARGDRHVLIELLHFLRDWLYHHIAVVDQLYSSYLDRK